MSASSNCIEDYVAAMFAYEFMDGGVDYDSLDRLHRGEVSDWVSAVAGSGLFTNTQVDRIDAQWRLDPKSLLETLLSEADEMTVRRCEMTWAALDRPAPVEHDEMVVGGYSNVVVAASTTIA
ncbi:hypothetical protein M2284_004839 [Rhodococcus sp. LBL1]|nr:hypothetical protein [Rhodococcus sp. LBL1]MDH6686069.1 hypothetical protein [Rhodococcus sp. LBL2]